MSQPWDPAPPPLNAATAPSNNLALAIIATVVSLLFCCLPHGVISLIFALQVDKKAQAGDIQGAMNAAKQAKIWAFVSIAVAIVSLVLSLIFGVLNAILSQVR